MLQTYTSIEKSIYLCVEMKHKCKKVGNGKYNYRGYDLYNYGYYASDKCVWWEGTDTKTNCGDFHAATKKDLKIMIDEDLDKTKPNI